MYSVKFLMMKLLLTSCLTIYHERRKKNFSNNGLGFSFNYRIKLVAHNSSRFDSWIVLHILPKGRRNVDYFKTVEAIFRIFHWKAR